MSKRTSEIISWIVGGIVVVALIVGMAWLVKADNEQMDRERQQENAIFERANTICGSSPKDVETHGSSWNWGPFIEVHCQDGTVRVIRG